MNFHWPHEVDWRLRVFDSLSFPTLVLKPDRTIVAVNQKLLERFDWIRDDIVGKTCREFFQSLTGDQDLPCANNSCPLDQTLADGLGHSMLRQIQHRDGSEHWEDRVFSPILDEQGEVIYIIESIRDVTRSKALEKNLQDVREFLNRVLQSSASAIVAAGREGRVLLMNQAAEELFGYSFKQARDIDVSNLYPPGVARGIMKKLRDDTYGGRGKLPVTRVDILTAQNEPIPVEMTAAIIYEDGSEAATMGVYNDLRSRLAVEKKLQEAQTQLVQTEKMASLGRLAAGVAHEINNPLTGILLYGNLMKEKLEGDHPLQFNLHCILEDAGRCQDIVKDLLAYSRQSSTSRDRFSLNALVIESFRLIRDQKLFINMVIRKELSGDWMPVRADRNNMSQVVINLVMNALDVMNKKGTLTLRTYRDDSQKTACLEVSDTGGGIPEENMSRVFDPFFTTKELGKGTGLGLSTAYGIVKDNNGDISIKETGPGGTTFLVALPLDLDSMEDNQGAIG
ncbi:MAG: PAS domain S-box protein [Deltaproteobacteria bacterium]|nr:PAS domain S-box protein [Deltaproteobacteria bacterium]